MKECDVLIIGAGPAGLTAALYTARYGNSLIIVDQGAPGGQMLLMDEIENYPGVGKIKGFELAERMEKEAKDVGVEVLFEEISSIEKKDGKFISHGNDDDYISKAVLISSGASHRKLGAEGEDELVGRGVSYCATCDGPFFRGKSVVVVGGGDTALTDALYLSKIAKEVHLVHRRDEFRGQKILSERVRKCENITLHLKRNVKKILSENGKVSGVLLDSGEEIRADGVFILVGVVPNSAFVSSLVETENGFIKTDGKMETSASGIFASGDVRTTPLRQVSSAVGDGAIASHAIDEYIRNTF